MISKILVVFAFLCIGPVSSDDEVISWRDNIKLSWNQFKAATRSDVSAAAVTASGITFEFSVKETDHHIVSFNTRVYAHFYPSKSWYNTDKSDDHILAHEQLHFDITELYARKFRKQIAQIQTSNKLKSDFRNLHQKINEELELTQNRYDQESDNSINQEFQSKWNQYVSQELNKLDAYKSKD